jgi:hypothetical protein
VPGKAASDEFTIEKQVRYIKGFDEIVTSSASLIATGWSDPSPGGNLTRWISTPFTAHSFLTLRRACTRPSASIDSGMLLSSRWRLSITFTSKPNDSGELGSRRDPVFAQGAASASAWTSPSWISLSVEMASVTQMPKATWNETDVATVVIAAKTEIRNRFFVACHSVATQYKM